MTKPTTHIGPSETRDLGRATMTIQRLGTVNLNLVISDEQGQVCLHETALRRLHHELGALLEGWRSER